LSDKPEPLEVRLARLEADVRWLRRLYRSLDARVWGILAGVITLIILVAMG